MQSFQEGWDSSLRELEKALADAGIKSGSVFSYEGVKYRFHSVSEEFLVDGSVEPAIVAYRSVSGSSNLTRKIRVRELAHALGLGKLRLLDRQVTPENRDHNTARLATGVHQAMNAVRSMIGRHVDGE